MGQESILVLLLCPDPVSHKLLQGWQGISRLISGEMTRPPEFSPAVSFVSKFKGVWSRHHVFIHVLLIATAAAEPAVLVDAATAQVGVRTIEILAFAADHAIVVIAHPVVVTVPHSDLNPHHCCRGPYHGPRRDRAASPRRTSRNPIGAVKEYVPAFRHGGHHRIA